MTALMSEPVRLLLVEDAETDARLILEELERASLEVTALRVNTESGFRRELQRPLDLVLANYSLRELPDAAALPISRELAPEVPFIFVAGSVGEERTIELLRNGASDYVLKNRLSRLGPAVRRVLDERRRAGLHRAADEAIRESEIRFRSVAESAADGILLNEASSTIIYANHQAMSMFGLPADAVVGRSVTDLLPPNVREDHMRAVQELAREGQIVTAMKRATVGMRGDGSEFPIELSISTWRRDGKLYFTEIVRDVSERVAAERRERMRLEVRLLLAESRSPAEALPELIRTLTEGLGWRAGTVWLADPASRRLACAGAWMQARESRDAFRDACVGLVREEGEGLAGRALLSLRPGTAALPDGDASPEHEIAARSGALRVTAVPLHVRGIAPGVIEFFEGSAGEPDPAMLEITSEMARQAAEYLERLRSEEQRLAATARLREAQQLARIGSWEYDAASRSLSLSDEVYAMFGVRPSRRGLTLRAYVRAVHREDRDRVREAVRSQFESGQPETLHLRHRIHRDGEERVLEIRSRVVPDGSGAIARALGTVQDITEQSLAALTIDRLSRRNQMILDCAAEGILGVDVDGVASFSNPAALALVGWTEEQLRASGSVHAAIHHTRADGTPYPLAECPLHQTLRDGRKRVVTGEHFWRSDGRPVEVDLECAPIVERGEIAGAVMTFRDITESHRMKRQLDLARRVGSLGRVAATIAHEFNNVLMGIGPFVEIVQQGVAAGDESLINAADHISGAVRRGRRVTDEILRFTRAVAPALQRVELNAWLLQLEPELRELAGAAVPVLLSIPAAPAIIACDAAQLQQVVTNLVANARDAMNGRGRISVVLRAAESGDGGEGVQLIVRDSGPGIPPQDLEHVFEPLFTTKRAGTGLGLSVVRQIVTEHGGSIEACNAEGGGAEFRITLPSGVLPSPAVVDAGPVVKSDARKLLLVEDDDTIAAGVSLVLEAEGFEVRWVSRGEVAVQEAEEFGPDAVILDLSLPDVNGREVFRRLRDRWPALPVVFSTGEGGVTDLEAALRGGHSALLQKPFTMGELTAAIHRVVTR